MVNTADIETAVSIHASVPGGLMPALHDLQNRFGHIPAGAIAVLAGTFNLSQAEVFGVVTFYKDFTTEPPTRPVVAICRAEACQSRGANALVAHARAHAADRVEIHEVFCFGNCALGPTVVASGKIHGRVDAERYDAIVGEVAP